VRTATDTHIRRKTSAEATGQTGPAAAATNDHPGTDVIVIVESSTPAPRPADRYCAPPEAVVAGIRAQVAAWPALTPSQVSLLAHAFAPAVAGQGVRREQVAA